ncbi:MAG: hypothetical protein AAGI38_20115 [Bacteroidota bacterium]
MKRFEQFERELQTVIPFRIRFKDESPEMKWLYPFVALFCPDFLRNYTTVIGSTIYFPSREKLQKDEVQAIRTLAHEAVHLLDAERWGMPIFAVGYLFPQILALGVFLMPFIGLSSILFLLFLLPWPSPFRTYAESRGYALDVLTTPFHQRDAAIDRYARHFSAWSYYLMFPFPGMAKRKLHHWVHLAETGKDPVLFEVLTMYKRSI